MTAVAIIAIFSDIKFWLKVIIGNADYRKTNITSVPS